MAGRNRTSSSVAPTLLALGVLVLATCGRTALDSPVLLTGSAGTTGRAGTTGQAGTSGQAGTGGKAGTGGPAGTGGLAGTGGIAGTGGAGTGGAQCEEGKSMCTSLTAVSLCQNGKWAFPTSCSMQCLSGVCTECVPGDKQCAGPSALRTCTSHGLWPEPEPCPGDNAICAAGACSNVDGGVPDGTCMDGTTECQDPMTVRLCQGGKWGVFFGCDNGCIGGVCAECKAGDVRCNVSNNNHEETCSVMGIWVSSDKICN